MIHFSRHVLMLITLAIAFPVSAKDLADYVNTTVMVIKEGAEIRGENGKTKKAGVSRIVAVKSVEGNTLILHNEAGSIDASVVLPIDEAMAYFDKQVAENPSAFWYNARGMARMTQKDIEHAIEDLDQAIKLDPKADYFTNRGHLHHLSGDTKQALVDLDKAVQLEPKNPDPLNNRGIIFMADSQLDKAIRDFDAVIALDSKNLDAFNSRGNARSLKNDKNGALIDFQKALEIDPEHPAAYNSRGNVYRELGEYEKAVEDFRQAISRAKYQPDAYNNLAWILATCADPDIRNGEEALKNAKQACVMTQFIYPGWLDTLAAAFAETGDFESAIKWQQQAIDRSPPASRSGLRPRLLLYGEGTPYHERPVEKK